MITVYYFLHNSILVKTTHINEPAPLLLKQYHELLNNSYIVVQHNNITGSYCVIKEYTIVNKQTLHITASVYDDILYSDIHDVTPIVLGTSSYREFINYLRKEKIK